MQNKSKSIVTKQLHQIGITYNSGSQVGVNRLDCILPINWKELKVHNIGATKPLNVPLLGMEIPGQPQIHDFLFTFSEFKVDFGTEMASNERFTNIPGNGIILIHNLFRSSPSSLGNIAEPNLGDILDKFGDISTGVKLGRVNAHGAGPIIVVKGQAKYPYINDSIYKNLNLMYKQEGKAWELIGIREDLDSPFYTKNHYLMFEYALANLAKDVEPFIELKRQS